MNIQQFEFLKAVTDTGMILFAISAGIALIIHVCVEQTSYTRQWLFGSLLLCVAAIACHYVLLGARV